MKRPELVDQVELYIPQLANLALQWEPIDRREKKTDPKEDSQIDVNTLEKLLLIMSQLSTRFALQYHWTMQSFLLERQPEASHTFDAKLFSRCMSLSSNLERCMNGEKRPQALQPNGPTLEIMTSYGGKVTNDEFVPMEKETNQGFYESIVNAADSNVSQSSPGTDKMEDTAFGPQLPMQNSFGGVLFFKRQHRKAGRRKNWKRRYFAVEKGMLNCYSRNRELLRSLPLDGATIWKGPKKYQHSFIVANDDVLFYLRANSEEQKSLWKRKLHQTINESRPSKILAQTQLERWKAYRNGKWFGRMITETNQELDGIVPEQRGEYLNERFFELDIPKRILWPWRDEACIEERYVYSALPHFSSVIQNSGWLRGKLPHFQASFWMKEGSEIEQRDSFLQEGRQLSSLEGSHPLPASISEILSSSRIRNSLQNQKSSASISGESTEGTTNSTVGGGYESGDTEYASNKAGADPTEILRHVEIEYVAPLPVINDDAVLDQNEENDEVYPGTDSSCASSQTSLAEDSSFEGESATVRTLQGVQNDKDENDCIPESINFSIEMEYTEEDSCPHKAQRLFTLVTKAFSRDEMLVTKLMTYFQSLFERKRLDLWIKPPRVRRINKDIVIMEVAGGNAISIGQAKRSVSAQDGSLRCFMVQKHGSPDSDSFLLSQQNFAKSLAGLSLVSYLLELKERHDDNLVIDDDGHVYARNMSWAFGSEPGSFSSAMEVAPFKLTKEMVEVMDGPNSELFQSFQKAFIEGFVAIRDDVKTVSAFIEMALSEHSVNTSSSKHGEYILRSFRQKLMVSQPMHTIEKKASMLIQQSQNSLMTSAYDMVKSRSAHTVLL